MAHNFDEGNLEILGMNKLNIALLRDISESVDPEIISLGNSQIEALIHEFRLLRNERDAIRSKLQELEIRINQPVVHPPIEEFLQYAQPVKPDNRMYAYSTNESLTAKDNEFIAVTANATIKLPEVPGLEAVVAVLNVNGSTVAVDGNGNNINNDTATKSYRANTLVNYHWFQDLGAWYMR